VLDVIASVVLLVISGGISFGVVVSAFAYGGLNAECGAGPYTGLTCNATVLAIVVYGLMAIAIIAGFLGLGMVIVSLIRRRYTFWWPLAAIVVTVGFFYLGTWVAGMTVPA
jgi:hypothetical protein